MAHIRVAPSAAFCVPRLSTRPEQPVRTLAIVFGDQLNRDSCVFDGFDAALDAVFMAEVREESEYVWSTKSRVALFLTAMRHFAQALHAEGLRVFYSRLDDPANTHSLKGEAERAVALLRPAQVAFVDPGEWRIQKAFRELSGARVCLSLVASLRGASEVHNQAVSVLYKYCWFYGLTTNG